MGGILLYFKRHEVARQKLQRKSFQQLLRSSISSTFPQDKHNRLFFKLESPPTWNCSVLADCQSDIIDDLLSAVGIMYYVVTGPYWKLITSDVEYLDLYQYIVPMREKFLLYSTDASSLADGDLDSIIPNFSIDGGDECTKLEEVTDKKLVQEALQKLFEDFLLWQIASSLTFYLVGGIMMLKMKVFEKEWNIVSWLT